MSTFAVRLTRPGCTALHVHFAHDEWLRKEIPPGRWVCWTQHPDAAASYDWPTAMEVARLARRSHAAQEAGAAVTVEPIKPVPA